MSVPYHRTGTRDRQRSQPPPQRRISRPPRKDIRRLGRSLTGPDHRSYYLERKKIRLVYKYCIYSWNRLSIFNQNALFSYTFELFFYCIVAKRHIILVTWQNLCSAKVCKESFLRGSFIGVFPVGIDFPEVFAHYHVKFSKSG